MDVDLALDRLTKAGCGPADDRVPDGVMAQSLRDLIRRHCVSTPARAADASGMAMVATVLCKRFLRFDAGDMQWPDRDRLVVGATRFGPLLRAMLTLCAEPEAGLGSLSASGFGAQVGIEMAVGPAGQGIASAVGMAMAERLLAQRFGHSLVDHRTWVLACETDLSAGVALEAASFAGQMRLDRLTVLFELEARGAPGEPGDIAFEPMARFAACGWAVRRVDAADPEAVSQAIAGAARGRRPCLIACFIDRQANGHSVAGTPEHPDGTEEQKPAVLQAWKECGDRGNTARRAWLKRLARHRYAAEFEGAIAGRMPAGWRQAWQEAWQQDGNSQAAFCGARFGIDTLLSLLPEFVSLSCEAGLQSMPPLGRVERALRLGTQEHGMAAALNGIALHGGLLACGSASFIAVDRMRPALRLGALMGRQVIHLLTHDGLERGEDGAAWQPVEQLASLRAMPNVAVLRPADGNEMMECWQLALHRTTGPSLIAFSSALPLDLRKQMPADGQPASPYSNPCARGGYVLADVPTGCTRDATLIATGPETSIALEASLLLSRLGLHVAVVSLPCWELFAAQSSGYREIILGSALRVGVEAASGFGWERWLGPDGIFIGIDEFGIAAPADAIYRQFGITPAAVADRVRQRLGVRGDSGGAGANSREALAAEPERP